VEADVETAVLAMKRGTFDFLLETCSDQRLWDTIDEAFRWDAAQRKYVAYVQSIRRRLKQLTPPLHDVLDLLLKGKSNREIAGELALSVRAIEVRRAKLMQAMKARTLAALLRQTVLVYGVGPSRSLPGPAVDPRIQHECVTMERDEHVPQPGEETFAKEGIAAIKRPAR
jgi:DNA-binding NarL/FixJ family response regulator